MAMPRCPTFPQTNLRSLLAAKKTARLQFAFFIKILLQLLRDGNDLLLYRQSRILIATCTSRHRIGDRQFSPLTNAIASRLRPLVGEEHWYRAAAILQSNHGRPR